MSETVEVRNQVRVYVGDPDEVPDGVEVHEYEGEDLPPGNDYYYEVSLDDLAEKIQKRYVYYDGPEGVGYFDTVRKELTVKRVRDNTDTPDDRETQENSVKKQIFEKADGILEKYKIYISEADTMGEAQDMAPEWADVQVSEQGSFYYEKLPGQGDDGDDSELTTGDYEVDTQFGRIMADRVMNDDVGDIPVDDFHEYIGEIDDPDLVRDALLAEKNGPDRKTGKQFIEKRARDLGMDIDGIYKDAGPDVTKNSALTSLSEMEVNVEELSDEPLVTPEDNDYVDREWSVRSIYETYIVEGKPTPTGMGNPDDIPAGTLGRILEEEVDDPTVLMDFWEQGSYQTKSDVREILEEQYGVTPSVETVDSELRFDLDNMEQWMPEEEVQELEPGDQILMDDFAGGFQEAEVEAVTATGLEVSSPDGMGATHEISFLDVYSDEYAVAAMLEGDAEGRANGMLDYTFPENVIERVEDDSVLTRAKKWEEQDNSMDLRPETMDRINARLSELNPPDPDEYGMDEEAMDMLHGAEWPEWSLDVKAAGSGISQNLREVYENTTTDDLEKYREVCEDNALDDRAKVVNGMLYYREDSDVELTDIVEYERVAHGNYAGVTGDMEERVMGAAEDSFNAMDPHVGAQLAAHIDKFELQNPDGNWVGQAQNGGRRMAIDNPRDVHRTTAHEMGHALHNFMGIKNDGYGTIDNRNHPRDPDRWEFGAKPPTDANEDAQEFYDAMEEEWEAYKDTKQGNRDDANELRSYQKRHGVELMAVGFGHYVSDPFKIRNRHPGLAEVYDKHLTGGVRGDISPDEVEEGDFYNVAIEGRGRETVEIERKETYENGDVEYLVSGAETGSRVHGREWMGADKLEFEEVNDDYEPVEIQHGKKMTVEMGDDTQEVYLDTKSRAMGGDFQLVDEMGNVRGQWTEQQLKDNLVEQTDESIDEMPWHPSKAESGDLVEMYGVEVQVRDVDTWDDEVTLVDSQGESQKLSFDEVQDLRESGEFEPVESVVGWEEMNTGENYSFSDGEASYRGEVVGFTEDEVTIDQGNAGTSTLDRDEIEEVNRRV